MTEPVLYLHATSLFSKWGFGDGDCLSDWWWDVTDGPLPDDVDEDDLLEQLVRSCLLPAIEDAGHAVEIYRIGTIHNPVRARTAGEQDVARAVIYGDAPAPAWAEEISVAITRGSLSALLPGNTSGH